MGLLAVAAAAVLYRDARSSEPVADGAPTERLSWSPAGEPMLVVDTHPGHRITASCRAVIDAYRTLHLLVD